MASEEYLFYENSNRSSENVGSKRTFEESNLSTDETSSSPSKQQKLETEATRTLKDTLPGISFQVNLIMLFIRRALKQPREFTIATEMADGGKFDDVVYKYNDDSGRQVYRFIQAKHTKNDIVFNDLITTAKSHDNFVLSKYFLSYCKIKSNPFFQGSILKDFIICTNSDFKFTIKKKKSGEPTKYGSIEALWKNRFVTTNLSEDDKILFVRKDIKIKKFKETELESVIKEFEESFNTAVKVEKIMIEKKLKSMPNNKKFLCEQKMFENVCLRDIMEEFFTAITFITNYPNESDLAKIVEEELGKDFNLLNPRFVSDTFKVTVINWLKEFNEVNKSAPVFTRGDGEKLFSYFKNLIFSVMVSGVSNYQINELFDYKIGFSENLDCIKKFLDSKCTRILQICSSEIRLTAIKVLQTLQSEDVKSCHTYVSYTDGYIFVDFKQYLKCQDAINSSFIMEQCAELLIIECDEGNDNKLLKDLSKTLNVLFENQKKLILITSKTNKNLSRKVSMESIKIFDDKMNFNDLDENSRDCILKKTIIFNGYRVSLRTVLNCDITNDVIKNQILSRLVEKKTFRVGSKTLTDIPEYYIERDIYMLNLTKDDLNVLRNQNVLLLISGMTKEDLLNCGIVASDIDEWKCDEGKGFDDTKFIISLVDLPLVNNQEKLIFNKMVEFNRNNKMKAICWLVYARGTFHLKKCNEVLSTYSDEVLETMKSLMHFDRILEKFILEHVTDNLIILAAEPGEGKSLFMNSVAKKIENISKQIKNTSHKSWVVRINLNDFAKLEKPNLDGIKFSMNETEKAIKFLSDMVIQNGQETLLEKELFKAVLATNQNPFLCKSIPHLRVFILIDGFDEICPTYKENTSKLIQALRNSSSALICVTTRLNMADDMLKTFQSDIYSFLPLTFKELLNLCYRFLKYSIFRPKNRTYICRFKGYEKIINLLRKMESYLKKLKNYSDSSLSHNCMVPGLEISLSTNHLDDCHDNASKLFDKYYSEEPNDSVIQCFPKDLEDFPSLELYLKLFLKKLDKSTNSDKENFFTKTPLNLILLVEVFLENKFEMPSKLNLKELYGKFVDRKFDIYLKEKSKTNSGNVAQNTTNSVYRSICTGVHEELAMKEFDIIKDLPKRDEFKNSLGLMENPINYKDELCRIGLVKIEGDKIEFIHRSLAEYFVATCIFGKRKPDNALNKLCEEILIEERFLLIRKFLNHILESICLRCHGITKKHNRHNRSIRPHYKRKKESLCLFSIDFKLTNHIGGKFNRILDCSIVEGLTVLVEYLLCIYNGNKINLIKSTNRADKKGRPLQLAVHYGRTEIFQLFFKTIVKSASIRERPMDFLRAIFQPKGFKSDNVSLIHLAVNSLNTNMISVLFRTFKEIKTLLLSKNQCFDEFFQWLVLAQDIYGETALHHCVKSEFPERTCQLFNVIKNYTNEEFLYSLILKSNNKNQTALHTACIHHNLKQLEVILKELKEHFTNRDKNMLKKLILQIDSSNEAALKLAFKNCYEFQLFEFTDMLLTSINYSDAPWYETFQNSLLDLYNKIHENPSLHLLIITGYTKFIREVNCNNESYFNSQIIQQNYENGCTSLFFFMSRERIDEIKRNVSEDYNVPIECDIGKPENRSLLKQYVISILENLFLQQSQYSSVICWVHKHFNNNLCSQFISLEDDNSHVTDICLLESNNCIKKKN